MTATLLFVLLLRVRLRVVIYLLMLDNNWVSHTNYRLLAYTITLLTVCCPSLSYLLIVLQLSSISKVIMK